MTPSTTQERLQQFRCIRTVFVDGTKEDRVHFRYGKMYNRAFPKIWPVPDKSIRICLINEHNEEHFMDAEFLHKHFEKV